ncbi:cytochrome P450 52E2 [Xylaria arbuscula]|nr:cytochrome P450 52E2 [Xylaria arbuscula]
MLFPRARRDNVDSLARAAHIWYYAASVVVAVLATRQILHVVSSVQTQPQERQQQGHLTRSLDIFILAILAAYVFGPLRADHAYYAEAARRGCKPIPKYPATDVLGLRYLVQTARTLKAHFLLQSRRLVLEALGHTFVHGVFPDWQECITTDEPEIVKAVLVSRFEDWALPASRIKSFLPVLGKHSIFTTNGAEWQHSRAILRLAFVRDQISDLACIDRHVSNLIAHIRRQQAIATPDPIIDLQALFSMVTTDSISDFMLGQSTDLLGSAPEESYKFGMYFDESMQKIAWRARLGWLTMLRSDPELDEYSSFMRAFVKRFVSDVRDTRSNEMKTQRKYVFLDELRKSGESDEVICDHLLSIFTAGRDTQTSVLTYLFFELSRRPDIVDAIRAEIHELGRQDPTWDDLRNMKYLNWVLKEALRLNPPVATNQREAVRDTVIPLGGGPDAKAPVFVKKGTQLRYIPWVMHRRKDLFGEDAEEFRPERWEDLRVTFEYLPFNAGPRICIGQQFALTQMALITFRLLQAFKAIERRDDRPPIQKLGINLSMLYGCLVTVTPA